MKYEDMLIEWPFFDPNDDNREYGLLVLRKGTSYVFDYKTYSEKWLSNKSPEERLFMEAMKFDLIPSPLEEFLYPVNIPFDLYCLFRDQKAVLDKDQDIEGSIQEKINFLILEIFYRSIKPKVVEHGKSGIIR
jgi:hypothetical protein